MNSRPVAPPTLSLVALVFACLVAPVEAYVGPGAGIGLLGALWGLLAAVGAALAFVLAWPIRRMLRRSRAARRADDVEVGAR